MSRRHATGSSLELLLDIVCNSFGSVVFVAILLSVIISIRGLKKDDPAPDQNESIEEIRQRLSRLQEELAEIARSTEKQAELLKNMESDPRLRLIHEIALLERMHQERQLRLKLTAQKLDLARSSMKNQEIQTQKVIEEEREIDRQLKARLAELEKIKEKKEELEKKLSSADVKNLVFMTIVTKENMPYHIFVNDGKIWPVGPELSGGSAAPNSAVTCEVKSGRYVCTPVADRGIAIFSGDALSPEFRSFMKSLPSDRIPEFVISKSDAPVFFRLREILKKEKVFHGFRMQKTDRSSFEFEFVNRAKGKYEY